MVVENLILAVVFLSAAGTFLGAMDNWKKQHASLQESSSKVIADKDVQITTRDAQIREAGEQLRQLEVLKAAAETGMASAQESMKNLNEVNAQQKESLERLSNTYDKMVEANTRLQAEKADLVNSLNTAQTDARQARDETDTRNSTIAQLTQQVEDLTAQLESAQKLSVADAEKIDKLSTVIALYAKVFGDLPGGLTPIDVAGRVQAVDNEMDIFVISVGDKDQVKVGHEFTVYRNNEYVSTIVVDQVFPNHASCHTKKGMKKTDVKSGDEVATRL
jgi:hypothetical protein